MKQTATLSNEPGAVQWDQRLGSGGRVRRPARSRPSRRLLPPEVNSLGRIIGAIARSDRRLALRTGHLKRTGFGFRRFRNYRIRVLLCAGRPNWDLVPTITPR